MTKEKRNQGILIIMALSFSVFGYIITDKMGMGWSNAPFLFTILMISSALIIVSSNPIYKYLCEISYKKRTIIIAIIVFIISIISIVLHVVFFIQYAS
jgi:hypothetical protein